METLRIVELLIAFILIMLGIIAIYDARKLAAKWFSFYDKNEAARWLKIVGFTISIIGIITIFLVR